MICFKLFRIALFIFALELELSNTNTSAAATKRIYLSFHHYDLGYRKSDRLLDMDYSNTATLAGDITDGDRFVLVMDRTIN
jgi:hypothetical protein